MLRRKEREDPVEMGRQQKSMGPYRSAISDVVVGEEGLSAGITVASLIIYTPWNAGHIAKCDSCLGAPAYRNPVSLQELKVTVTASASSPHGV